MWLHAVRSFTGMDRNGPDYRNGLPECHGHLYVSVSTFHLVFEDRLA